MSRLSFQICTARPGRPQPYIGGFGAGVIAGLITLGVIAFACIAVGLIAGAS